MNAVAGIPGFIQLESHHSVATTIERLDAMLRERGILVFARIDFAGDAQRAGLRMRPEQLLIFGNPKAGTPLMLAQPQSALDLPLKVLVLESANGQVSVSFNTPQYIIRRHALPESLSANLAPAFALIARALQP